MSGGRLGPLIYDWDPWVWALALGGSCWVPSARQGNEAALRRSAAPPHFGGVEEPRSGGSSRSMRRCRGKRILGNKSCGERKGCWGCAHRHNEPEINEYSIASKNLFPSGVNPSLCFPTLLHSHSLNKRDNLSHSAKQTC